MARTQQESSSAGVPATQSREGPTKPREQAAKKNEPEFHPE